MAGPSWEEGPAEPNYFRAARLPILVPYDPVFLDTAPPRVLFSSAMSDPVSQEPDVSDADLFTALEASRGNIAEAARNVGKRRSYVSSRIDRSPALKSLMEDIRETVVDKAESNRFADVEKGDPGASNFILQTLGKNRGYTTGVAGSGKDGAILVEIRSFTNGEESADRSSDA